MLAAICGNVVLPIRPAHSLREITGGLATCLGKLRHLGVENAPIEIHIRDMKNKWASCSTNGRLTFATALLDEPRKKRYEVIVYELLHLRYPNHGKMFGVLLNSYLNKGVL